MVLTITLEDDERRYLVELVRDRTEDSAEGVAVQERVAAKLGVVVLRPGLRRLPANRLDH